MKHWESFHKLQAEFEDELKRSEPKNGGPDKREVMLDRSGASKQPTYKKESNPKGDEFIPNRRMIGAWCIESTMNRYAANRDLNRP